MNENYTNFSFPKMSAVIKTFTNSKYGSPAY